ncbi:MAG TPA: type II 3-dehydroquinate dehydratase [Burkholderiales bacterium]|nr:type II 3-dehydroquinate dehydratase [Burkholderiales bacterium]
MKILVLHGPNLNLLGRREPHIYGSTTLQEINSKLEALAAQLKVQLAIVQSNHEGVLVDALHKHIDEAAGAIINPAGLTQFGVSLHDAIKTMPFPVIEVHISNRHAREEWRGHSIISSAVKGTVEGLGWRSYAMALRALVEMAAEKK